MHRNAVPAGVFHAAQHQHLRPGRGHLQHLLVGDVVQPARVRHDPRIGGEHAVHVGVDLADVGVQRRRQRNGGGVRAAPTEGGDVLGVLGDALETGHQRDMPLIQRLADTAGGDVDDAGPAVHRRGDHPGLRAGVGAGLGAERVDRHRHQALADPLAGGQQHVQLAAGRQWRDLGGEVHQFVGGVAHRR